MRHNKFETGRGLTRNIVPVVAQNMFRAKVGCTFEHMLVESGILSNRKFDLFPNKIDAKINTLPLNVVTAAVFSLAVVVVPPLLRSISFDRKNYFYPKSRISQQYKCELPMPHDRI